MTVKKRILKRNNYTSYITIPKEMLEKLELTNNDEINISCCDDIIFITKNVKEEAKNV